MPSGFRLARLAERELDEAVAWYEGHSLGKGLVFAREVYETIDRAMRFPASGTPVRDPRLTREVRYYRLNPEFPYDIVTSVVEGNMLFVFAVAHQSREPGYWVSRTGEAGQ